MPRMPSFLLFHNFVGCWYIFIITVFVILFFFFNSEIKILISIWHHRFSTKCISSNRHLTHFGCTYFQPVQFHAVNVPIMWTLYKVRGYNINTTYLHIKSSTSPTFEHGAGTARAVVFFLMPEVWTRSNQASGGSVGALVPVLLRGVT